MLPKGDVLGNFRVFSQVGIEEWPTFGILICMEREREAGKGRQFYRIFNTAEAEALLVLVLMVWGAIC